MSDPVRKKLRDEVMKCPWSDLIPHFARGGLLLAEPALDLLDAASAIARDDQALVKDWLQQGQLRRATDADAKRLVDQPTSPFQFVVVQPWVLAQPLPR